MAVISPASRAEQFEKVDSAGRQREGAQSTHEGEGR